MHYSESHTNMAEFKEAEVLIFVADEEHPHTRTLDAIEPKELPKPRDKATARMEKALGHVPDLVPYVHKKCLTRRRLCNWGDYYMYKCVEPTRANLKANRQFRNFTGARVYGDAFVFKVRVIRDSHGRRMGVFDGMEEFAYCLGANKRNDAFRTLGEMARM